MPPERVQAGKQALRDGDGVGAALFTLSISLINTALLWHLCQAGRKPYFATGENCGSKTGEKDSQTRSSGDIIHKAVTDDFQEIKRTKEIKNETPQRESGNLQDILRRETEKDIEI